MSIRTLPQQLQEEIRAGRRVMTPRPKRRADAAIRKARADEIRTQFRRMCRDAGLPMPVTEHRFHPERKWRWDYAWPDEKVALEVDGGLFVNGGHNRGGYLLKLQEKKNAATVLGWRILYCVPKSLCTESTIRLVRTAMELGGDRG